MKNIQKVKVKGIYLNMGHGSLGETFFESAHGKTFIYNEREFEDFLEKLEDDGFLEDNLWSEIGEKMGLGYEFYEEDYDVIFDKVTIFVEDMYLEADLIVDVEATVIKK